MMKKKMMAILCPALALALCLVLSLLLCVPKIAPVLAESATTELKISLTAEQAVVEGNLPGTGQAEILRVPTYADEAYDKADVVGSVERGQAFRLTAPRYMSDGFDSAYYRYYAVAGDTVLAGPKYPTEIPSLYDFEKPKAESVKGLQYQNVDDAVKLGIKQAGINFGIESLFTNEGDRNAIPFESNGKIYYIDGAQVANYDKEIMTLTDAGVEVTLICLLWGGYLASNAPEGLLHKDYYNPPSSADEQSTGYVAAPNMDDDIGVGYYAAAFEFAASRWLRPDTKYGRAYNFVISNEVDNAMVYHNMGKSFTFEQFMDNYTKCFRVAYTAVKKYYDDVNVLISLTHCWNMYNDVNFAEKGCFKVKDVLDEFARRNKAEGDYGWGVAHHAYPSWLGSSQFWIIDRETATQSFDTTRITIYNIEVLSRYLQQEHMLFEGKSRNIYLTEQGFNTQNNSEYEEKMQAAAFVYAYYKIACTPSIKCFLYHRQIDVREELGLNLGLWQRDPDTSSDPMRKKYIYDVFKDIDTERSQEVGAFALDYINATLAENGYETVDGWEDLIEGFDWEKIQTRKSDQEIFAFESEQIAPDYQVADFEDDTMGGWAPEMYATGAEVTDWMLSQPQTAQQGEKLLTVRYASNSASNGSIAEKGVGKVFETPVKVSDVKTFQLAVAVRNMFTSATKNETYVTVRFYGKERVYQSITPLENDCWTPLTIRMEQLPRDEEISKVKIWVSSNTNEVLDGSFWLDNIGFQQSDKVGVPAEGGAPLWLIVGGCVLGVLLVGGLVALFIIRRKHAKGKNR